MRDLDVFEKLEYCVRSGEFSECGKIVVVQILHNNEIHDHWTFNLKEKSNLWGDTEDRGLGLLKNGGDGSKSKHDILVKIRSDKLVEIFSGRLDPLAGYLGGEFKLIGDVSHGKAILALISKFSKKYN